MKGTYPEIPKNYSANMKSLIADMLIKEPFKRPSIRQVLEKDFLQERITSLLSNTIAKHEFSNTFLSKNPVASGASDRPDDRSNSENIPDERKQAWEEKKTPEETKESGEEIDSRRQNPLKIKKEQLKPKKTIDGDD